MYYQPSNWYWTIGADAANVWSSSRAALVPVSDPDYVVWQSDGRSTPNMATMADLENTLRDVYPRGTLKTAAADARFRKAGGGVIIQSLSPAAFFSDPVSRNAISTTYAYAKANPGYTTQWKLSDNTFIAVVEADLLKMESNIQDFVQKCFTEESTLAAGIDGATITTLAQIDAAFAAISNVYP
jgi:hypothetical protein